MKKVFVKQIDPEWQDNVFFMQVKKHNKHVLIVEDEGIEKDFIITGNDQLLEYYPDQYDGILENLKNFAYDIDYGENLQECAKYYFKKDFTEKELNALEHLTSIMHNRCEWDILTDLLNIITPMHWQYCSIHGSSQGEWQYMIYNDNVSQEMAVYIECCYFNTGYEWRVYYNEQDFKDDNDGEYLYTITDDKEDIAQELGVNANEIEVHIFCGYIKTATYKTL